MERASIVIVNWNAGAVLHDCLAAVFASDGVGRDQVIVVDNASTDGSQCRLTATYPTLEVIQNSRNVGFAPAVNQGLRAARGEFAVLLNPDVVLEPYALFRLIEFMTEHPEAGVAGPRLLDRDGAIQGSARRDPSVWTALFGRSAPLTRLFPNNRVSQREIPALSVEDGGPIQVDWVSGACLVARRTAWEERRAPRRALLPVLGGRGLVSPLPAGRLAGLLRAERQRDPPRRSEPRPPPARFDPGLPRERVPLLPEAPGAARPPSPVDPGRDRAHREPGCPVDPDSLVTASAASGRQLTGAARHEAIELALTEERPPRTRRGRRQARLTETIRESPGSSMVTP